MKFILCVNIVFNNYYVHVFRLYGSENWSAKV